MNEAAAERSGTRLQLGEAALLPPDCVSLLMGGGAVTIAVAIY